MNDDYKHDYDADCVMTSMSYVAPTAQRSLVWCDVQTLDYCMEW